MTDIATDFDATQALDQLKQAASDGHISEGAVTNIKRWLTEPRYAQYAAEVAAHLTKIESAISRSDPSPVSRRSTARSRSRLESACLPRL